MPLFGELYSRLSITDENRRNIQVYKDSETQGFTAKTTIPSQRIGFLATKLQKRSKWKSEKIVNILAVTSPFATACCSTGEACCVRYRLHGICTQNDFTSPGKCEERNSPYSI
ncbi:hypothetical protein IQ258_29510 [Coleofasciculus sp. LEGE 07081]|nr:hypothetical protein [Coleofasciculus sp. LEGE 07081]